MTTAALLRTIVVSPHPKGRFLDGIISGTPKPGTVMQIKAATEPVAGQYTFEVYDQAADGNRPQGPIFVLREDELQGITVDTAYADGATGLLYCPLPGDELLMLFANVAGTGDDHAIGEKLIIDDGTGKLIATTGTPECEPFMCAETVTDPTADFLAHVFYSGF